MPPPIPGDIVRRHSGNDRPTIRVVLYVRPDGLAAAVYLNSEFVMTEIEWVTKEPTKKLPEGEAFWKVAKRR